MKRLETFSSQLPPAPLGSSPRFQIISASSVDRQDLPQLGTYGFVKNPGAFIVGAIQDDPKSLFDLGYSMELLVLKAVELGIGSCWLGVTFTRKRFIGQMNLLPGEMIPAVASLGCPAESKAWMDRAARIISGADRRLPWDHLFFEESWSCPLQKPQAGKFQEPLRLLRLAPSASNKQPWRLLRDGNRWHFYLERTPNYPSTLVDLVFNSADLQRIDLGIAAAHFDLGLTEAGIRGKWVEADLEIAQPEPLREYIITWVPIS